jgi:hypothetical protein
MKHLLVLLLGISLVMTAQAQTFDPLKKTESQIKTEIQTLYGTDILGEGEYFVQNSKALVFDVETKELGEITYICVVNSKGYCSQFTMLANKEHYAKMYQSYQKSYSQVNSEKFVGNGYVWTFSNYKEVDYYSITSTTY